LKRSITDVLRRGILSTLANWPVILTRLAETLVLCGAVAVAIIGVVVPLLISAGMRQWRIPEKDAQDVVAAIIVEHAELWMGLLLFVFVIGLVMVAIHAFVTAGSTQIFVDAERAAPDAPVLRREQFAAFTLERWSEGAWAAWVRVFWIYNGAWGVFGLILLVPVLILGALTIAAVRAQSLGGSIAAGCGGSVMLILITIPLAIVIGMWAQKAIVICIARDVSAAEALRSGWRETRGDFLRHFLIYFLITIVSTAVSSAVSAGFAPFSFRVHPNDVFSLLTGPVQMVSFAAQLAASNAVGAWLIGSFAAMTKN